MKRPIIIVGSPRSGTSFLGQVFETLEEVTYLVEPRLIWKIGNDRRSDALRPEDARPEVRDRIHRRLEAEVAQGGGGRLVEKTPANSLRMGFIEAILPDCLFIHVIRNAYDSVLSIRQKWEAASQGVGGLRPGVWGQRWREVGLRRLPHYLSEVARRTLPISGKLLGPAVWGPRLPGLERMRDELGLLAACCMQWRMCVESACQHGRRLPASRYYEFHLEDLTPQVLKEVLEFAEIRNTAQAEEHYWRNYDAHCAVGRAAKADPKDLETIRRWTEPTMQWLGYPTTPGEPMSSAESAAVERIAN